MRTSEDNQNHCVFLCSGKRLSQECALKVVSDEDSNSERYGKWTMLPGVAAHRARSFVLFPQKFGSFPQPQPACVSLPKHLQGSESF